MSVAWWVHMKAGWAGRGVRGRESRKAAKRASDDNVLEGGKEVYIPHICMYICTIHVLIFARPNGIFSLTNIAKFMANGH